MPFYPALRAPALLAAAAALLPNLNISAAPQSLLVQGAVIDSGGNPPARPALIQTVCNGAPRAETYTDNKGRFSLQITEREATGESFAPMRSVTEEPTLLARRSSRLSMPDPVQRTTIDSQALIGCEVQAQIPGYRSDPIRLGSRGQLVRSDIGTIVVRKIGAVEGSLVSVTSLGAPKKARKAFEKGTEALHEKNSGAARKSFEEAVRECPEYAAAWSELAKLQAASQETVAARASLANAMRADDRYLPPYLTLAELQLAAKQWQEVDETTAHLLRLDPYDYPQAHLMSGMAHYNMGDKQGAEKQLREAQEVDVKRTYPQSWNLMAIILAEKGDYAGAAEQLTEYLRLTPRGANADAARLRLREYQSKAAN